MSYLKNSLISVGLLSLSACQSGKAIESAVPTSFEQASLQEPAVEQQTSAGAIDTNANLPAAIPTPQPAPERIAQSQPTVAAPQGAEIPSAQTNDSLSIMAVDQPISQSEASKNVQTTALAPVESSFTPTPVQQASLLQSQPAITDQQPIVELPRTRKTFLINGLLSAVPFIGYGFRNLQKKMPEATIHSYISPIESATVIMPKVLREIEAAYKADPNVSINLIGISLGADFITVVAEKLHKKNIPVNYLGIVDGTNLRPITANVVKADNLTCSFLDCTKARARLAKGNSTTIFTKKIFKSSHIPLGNNAELHRRVIEQSRS